MQVKNRSLRWGLSRASAHPGNHVGSSHAKTVPLARARRASPMAKPVIVMAHHRLPLRGMSVMYPLGGMGSDGSPMTRTRHHCLTCKQEDPI